MRTAILDYNKIMEVYDCDSDEDTHDKKQGSLEKKPAKFSLIENEVYKRFCQIGEELIEEDLVRKKEYFQNSHDLKLNDPNDLLVCYGNSEIRAADMIRLAPDTFLNDTVVNFFIKLFFDSIKEKETRQKLHPFNTYFFKSLDRMVIKLKETRSGRYLIQSGINEAFKTVSKCHKTVDIFEKKHLFVPVHRGGHWSAVIITNLWVLAYAIEKGASLQSFEESSRPCIVHLDPLWKAQRDSGETIRMYLEAALQARLGQQGYERRIKVWAPAGGFLVNELSLPDFQAIVPRQQNTSDCGLFVLEYLESFCKDSTRFIQSLFKRNHFVDWFPLSMINNKRVMLINIIIRITNSLGWEETIGIYLKDKDYILQATSKDPTEFEMIDERKIMAMNRQMAAEEFYDIIPAVVIESMRQEADEICGRKRKYLYQMDGKYGTDVRML